SFMRGTVPDRARQQGVPLVAQDQGFLVGKVPVHGHVRDACGGGDLLDSGGVKAFFQEETQGLPLDAAKRLQLAVRAPDARSSCRFGHDLVHRRYAGSLAAPPSAGVGSADASLWGIIS